MHRIHYTVYHYNCVYVIPCIRQITCMLYLMCISRLEWFTQLALLALVTRGHLPPPAPQRESPALHLGDAGPNLPNLADCLIIVSANCWRP